MGLGLLRRYVSAGGIPSCAAFFQFFGKGFDARGDGERMFCPKGQRLKLRDGQGARIEIALRIGASGLKQESGLFLGFHAFGNDLDAHFSGEGNAEPDDRLAAFGRDDLVEESPVDLDEVHGHTLEHVQGRVA